MPTVITETDLDSVSIIITQQGTSNPTVVVNASTKTDRPGVTRPLATEEVYSKLGAQAQTLIKSVLTSIRNRAKTQEGI